MGRALNTARWIAWLVVGIACAAGPPQEIPFVLLHNQILLEVRIDGQGPYNFVVDSGTYVSSIDRGLARRLHPPLEAERTEGKGAGAGRVVGQKTVLRRLEVGDLQVSEVPAVALDLSGVSRQFGRPLDGVLGYSFLSPWIIQIDYFRRRIGFYAESPFSPSVRPADTALRISFPMQFREGSILPVLEDCLVNGEKVAITLDTGSSLGLVLFPKAITHLGLEDLARDGIPLTASGYAGAVRLKKGWVRSLELKGLDLGAIEAAYVESGYGDDEELKRRGGNLGNAVLQDFVLTLDYRNRVVVLESTAD